MSNSFRNERHISGVKESETRLTSYKRIVIETVVSQSQMSKNVVNNLFIRDQQVQIIEIQCLFHLNGIL